MTEKSQPKKEETVLLAAPEYRSRDTYDGFALYRWTDTDARPFAVLTDEAEAHLLAGLVPGGCEVRRAVVRLSDAGTDPLGALLDSLDEAQEGIDAANTVATEELANTERAEKDLQDVRAEVGTIVYRLTTELASLAAIAESLGTISKG